MTFLHNTFTNRRGQSPLAVRATSLTCVLLDRRGTLVGYCTRNHTGVHPWSVRELKPNPFINRRGRIAKCSPFICPLCTELSTQPVRKTEALSAFQPRSLCGPEAALSTPLPHVTRCKPIRPLSNNWKYFHLVRYFTFLYISAQRGL